RVAVSHRAAVRRDQGIEAGSEPVEGRAEGITPEYVSDIRGVVTGIEDYLEAQEQERQAERIGEAVDAIVSGAEKLEHTAAALAGLDREVERKAQRLKRSRQLTELTDVGGVAEVVLRGLDPELVARARDRIAEDNASKPSKQQQRQQRREVYQRYAAKYSDHPARECDRLVACQLMDKLLKARGGQQLTQDEQVRVGRVLLEGPTSQELKQTQGKDASVAYVTEVMSEAQPMVERAQRNRLAEQIKRSQKKSRDQGMER
ncbi:MAG: hypothetical protein AAFV46_06560, partial [Cyanobacteria bacterium J06635_11]